MKKISYAVAAAAAAALISGLVMSQNLEGIIVQATRDMNDVHTPPGGASVKNVSVSYVVNTAGLDLAAPADVLALQKRVRDAALSACKDIGRHYPNSMPNDADCAKAAADKAMVKVNELSAAAAKKPAI